jgi:S-adenosylmethionine-dependent methyltransferase
MSAQRSRPSTAVRAAVVWQILCDALAELAVRSELLHILDIGGGTGGFAVPLAELGYRVTVIDPSPDALAALERRVAELGVENLVQGIQGDTDDMVEVIGPDSVDVVVCHSVLEVVDDPDAALSSVAAVLRPGGFVSVLAANRVAAVMARVAAGRLGDARALLADPDGSAGPTDPLARRFTMTELTEAVAAAGFRTRSTHGIRVFADIAPAGLLDVDPRAADDLVELERAVAADPAFASLATAVHVLADLR